MREAIDKQIPEERIDLAEAYAEIRRETTRQIEEGAFSRMSTSSSYQPGSSPSGGGPSAGPPSDNPSDNASDNAQPMSAINAVFLFFIFGSIIVAAASGAMREVTDASFDAAKAAVTLAIGLVGIMALWLGFVRILEAGGLMHTVARLMKPLMVRLFPDVPADHPAMGAMLLNIAANMLGLGNAATPFGVKAMIELNKLNPLPGTATNAMCLFLAINTSSVTLLPLGVIGVRAAAGADRPADIFLPTLIATAVSTVVGISAAKLLGRRSRAATAENEEVQAANESNEQPSEPDLPDYSHLRGSASGPVKAAAVLTLTAFFAAAAATAYVKSSWAFLGGDFISFWLMPGLMLLITAYGCAKGVKVYEAVTDGAKQGFDIAIRIIPFLVAILVAIAMFRASGAMEQLAQLLNPVTSLIGLPAEVVPLALVRPLSGSGAFGLMAAIVQQAPNSYAAFVASTMMGSTETTFYVLAVYFGAVGVVRVRYALAAGILADAAGVITASLVCRFFWSGPF